MDVSAYLERIGYHGSIEPTLATLRALHRAHLLAVPFENLDVIRKRPIVLDEARLFDKIVNRRRGGFCYELNGLFAALLRELGFDVQLHGAEVLIGRRVTKPDEHVTMIVQLEEPWLADVGFGDCFNEPLRLNETADQIQEGRSFRIEREGRRCTMWERQSDGTGEGYRFELTPRRLSDFRDMCHWTESSPDSSFTHKRICTRVTPTGRVTVSEQQLITTVNGVRSERLLADESECRQVLREQFGIELEGELEPSLYGGKEGCANP